MWRHRHVRLNPQSRDDLLGLLSRENKGINPFTKQKQTFAAKPASRAVKARPVKAN